MLSMLFRRMCAPERAKLLKPVLARVSNHLVLFLTVFFAGIACSVFIQIVPEFLSILPVTNSVQEQQRNNVHLEHAKYPPLPFGARALPWIQDLDVHDDFVQTIIRKENTALHIRHNQAAKDTEDTSLETESIASLRLALEMRHSGKKEKALKLFQHAYALNPTHPDILNYYGEFLEEHGKDVLQAEQLYSRALTLSPHHLKALVNRQRTLPMVEELDENRLTQIDIKRDHLINISDNDSSLKRIKKEAYFLHIYHTVGLEGNTMTLMETRQIVETRLAVGGKSLVENNEVLGLDAALVYVNSTLVHKLGALTLGDILDIHKRVMGFVNPIEAGHFRVTQVFVGNHIPPHPSEVLIMMNAFIQWLNSEEALRLHPVRYAALAHYKLVYIHPFADGNGRTSRLLMNLILMRAGFPPVNIRKQDRLTYYKYLEMANEGDVRPFIRFVAECTERTLDDYLIATKDRVIPALENGRLNAKATIIV